MKRVCFFVWLLLISFSTIFAQKQERMWKYREVEVIDQDKIQCIYQYDVRCGEDQRSDKIMLQIGNHVVKSCSFGTYLQDSLAVKLENKAYPTSFLSKKTQEIRTRSNASANITWSVFRNYPEGKVTIHDRVTSMEYYRSEEAPIGIDWNVDYKEEREIAGYICQKATGHYMGRDWIVWYAPELPISYGPWMLHGLPGLIFEALDVSEDHKFSILKINQTREPIACDLHSFFKADYDQVITLQRKHAEALLRTLQSKGVVKADNNSKSQVRTRLFFNPLRLPDDKK